MRGVGAGLLAILVALCVPARAEERAPDRAWRRGVGVHTLLNWGRLAPGRSDRYADAPFDDPDHALPDERLKAAARAGFDFARLTVDPGPFLQLTGAAREALDARLLATIARLQGLGFAVMVDLHGNTQVPAYDPQVVTASADSAVFRAYVALVARTAGLVARTKGRVALELMNEPQYGYDAGSRRRWQAMLESLHAAARGQAPDLLLVLTGARGGDREGLDAIDPAPFKGSRVLWSFHYYEPHDFTHQGVPASDPGRYRGYLSDLPYPSDSLPPGLAEASLRANLDADRGLDPAERRRLLAEGRARIAAYVRSRRDRAAIARDFDLVSAWASRHGIPADRVFLGEFGATRSYDHYRAADPVSYEAWMGDVRGEAEARGFGWAVWELTGYGGMSLLATDGGNRLDPGTLRALGLNAEP